MDQQARWGTMLFGMLGAFSLLGCASSGPATVNAPVEPTPPPKIVENPSACCRRAGDAARGSVAPAGQDVALARGGRGGPGVRTTARVGGQRVLVDAEGPSHSHHEHRARWR
jgi:hypothetical protein